MTSFTDKVIGVYHFIGDRAPKNVPLVEPKPRSINPWRRDGHPLLARVKAGDDIKSSVEKAIGLLGAPGDAISRGDRVMVKPNFNSPDPFPASTDLPFLQAVVEILTESGARVTIGESAGGVWRPTRRVYQELGLFEFARRLNVKLIAFEEKTNDWVKIRVNGDYLKTVTMPRAAYEADKIVYLPCMKTHQLARFSGALKLPVGLMHPGERRALHLRPPGRLEQKVAEISLCWQPNLIIMDGRKAFVSGGPDRGQLAEPGVVLASGDLIAIDVEAMKVILSYGAKNRLGADPWHSLQAATALKHGLGASDYVTVE